MALSVVQKNRSDADPLRNDVKEMDILENDNDNDNDLEDGEIEDDEDEEVSSTVLTESQSYKNCDQSSTSCEKSPRDARSRHRDRDKDKDKDRNRDKDHDKSRQLTEAEKSLLHLHRIDRERGRERDRDRKDKHRRDRTIEDWTCNLEKAIATVLNKDRSDATDSDEEVRNSRKKSRADSNRKEKRSKSDDEALKTSNDDQMKSDSDSSEKQTSGSAVLKTRTNYRKTVGRVPVPEFKRSHKDDHVRRKLPLLDNKGSRNRTNGNRGDGSVMATNEGSLDSNTATAAAAVAATEGPITKSDICTFYMQGKCHKNGDCLYSHDANPPLKMELCKFYLMNTCSKRKQCLYMHEDFPCKFYHMGMKCLSGDNCRFAHGPPLPDQLKNLLLKHIEVVPKELLGEFPRLTRDGAVNMLNNCQNLLRDDQKTCVGDKKPELNVIPSIFDIQCTIPPGFRPNIPPPNMAFGYWSEGDSRDHMTTEQLEAKKKRQSRWDESAANNFGFYDQPPPSKIPKFTQPPPHFTSPPPPIKSVLKLHQPPPQTSPALPPPPPQSPPKPQSEDLPKKSPTHSVQTSPIPREDLNNESGLEIDVEPEAELQMEVEIEADRQAESEPVAEQQPEAEAEAEAEEVLVNLPKKQRELFMRIQERQKEADVEGEPETSSLTMCAPKEEDWYSSDDEDALCISIPSCVEDKPLESCNEDAKIAKPLELEPSTFVAPMPLEIRHESILLPPPVVKPLDVTINKLGDLSKIDISDEVTKLLSTIKKKSRPTTTFVDNKLTDSNSSSTTISATSVKSVAVSSNTSERCGIYDDVDICLMKGSSVSDRGNITILGDLPDIAVVGSNILNEELTSEKVNFEKFKLQFKGIQNYTPATEINASINSHRPLIYKVNNVDIPKPSFLHLRINRTDPIVRIDPRLRRIFKINDNPNLESEETPKSPPSLPLDPRTKSDSKSSSEINNAGCLSEQSIPIEKADLSKQLEFLQQSNFYKTLTSVQKQMLSNELMSRNTPGATSDPLLAGMLANIGLGAAINNQVPSESKSVTQTTHMISAAHTNVVPPRSSRPGLLGAAPGISIPSVNSNEPSFASGGNHYYNRGYYRGRGNRQWSSNNRWSVNKSYNRNRINNSSNSQS